MTKKDIAVKEEEMIPVSVLEQVAGLSDDELGYSTKAEDSMVPILALLQENSGEVKKKSDRFIEGAEEGQFIIRSLGMVLKGPIMFQPCGFDHVLVEWEGDVGDGGVVGSYAISSPPDDMEEISDPENPDRTILRRAGSGNRLAETRYHYGHLFLEDGTILPLVIPMGGTNHQVSRQWTLQMKGKTFGGGKKAPSFFHAYKISSVYNQRGAQTWFKYKIEHAHPIVDEATLLMGMDLLRSVSENAIGVQSDIAEEEKMEKDSVPI